MRFVSVLICATALVLTGCAGMRDKPDALVLQQKVDALDREMIQGQQDPLAALDKYRALAVTYADEPIAVAAYAEALRRADRSKEAANVLRPFIKGKNAKTMEQPLFMAYMRLLLGQGYFADVESRVQSRLTVTNDEAVRAQLYNLLGVAFAGQGKKPEAEAAFQHALQGWSGRAGVVQQNLEKLKQVEKKDSLE